MRRGAARSPIPLWPTVALILGAIAVLSAAMLGVTSFTPFDPHGWVRIATMAPFPIALIGLVALGVAGLRNAVGRKWVIGALALDAVALLAFVVMIAIGG